MPNSLYQQLNGNQNQNNPNSILKQFEDFRRALQGDPKQIVMQLIQSGRMSQAQYQQLSQMASNFQNLLRRG